jgi:hypothetical protein
VSARGFISSRPPVARPHALTAVDAGLAALAGLLAFSLYLRTLAPGLLWGDSAEFQFAAWLGGFAHPTGYPLYLSLGWLWTHLLPWQDPAWRMNLFSALWGGIAVGLVYLLALRLLPALTRPAYRRLSALGAALVFAATPTFWSQAVVAEVYSLHAVFVAGVLLALLRWAEAASDRAGARRAVFVALLYGLSLAHHRTMILLAPAILVFVGQTLRVVPVSIRRHLYTPGRLALLALCLLAPLLLYLYIPLRAARVPYYQVALGPSGTLTLYDATFAGFVAHVTGSAFGAALGVHGAAGNLLAGLAARFVDEFTWPGVLLGLLGLAVALLGPARRRQPATALLVLGFLVIIAFNLAYGIGDIHVFFIPAYLIWTLWLAQGAAALARFVADAPAAFRPRRAASAPSAAAAGSPVHLLGALLLAALTAALATGNFAAADRSRDDTARAAWQAILAQPIPAGSLLLSNDRDEMVPQWYLRYVEGVRPDLVGLFPGIQPGAEWADVGQVTTRALRAGPPVYLIKRMPGLEIKFEQEGPLAPAAGDAQAEGQLGALMHVIGPTVEKTPDRPLALAFGDAVKLMGYDVEPAMATAGGTLAVKLYWQTQRKMVRNYTSFVHIVDADGTVLGQSDHQPGGVYYPTSLWRPGEVLADVHQIELKSPGRAPYSVIAGLYTMNPELQHLGSPHPIGHLALARAADVVPPDVKNRVNFGFGDPLVLLGYTIAEDATTVTIRMYWQATQPPAVDYSVFVHLLDAAGQIVAQQDQQPTGGRLPTSTWPRGYVLADEVVMRLPAGLAPGTYRLIAGLYDPLTSVRLPAEDATGRPLGDSVPLGEVVRGNG